MAVVRSREKQMSCLRAFDSNLPVLDVQIMGGGVGWRGAGGRTEKRESRERPLRQIQIFKLRGEGVGEGAGAHPVSSVVA